MPPEVRTRALVLRTFDQGESDRLVHLYTEAEGRVSAIAKGARRSRRRFPGTLEIFSLLDVRLVDPPRASLMRLEGARLVRSFEPLAQDLGRYAIACTFCELLDRLTGERESHPDLFRFAAGAIEVVAGETPDPLLALLLWAKTLARLGYRPQLEQCARCGAGLPASGRVAFDAREGGALCTRCSVPELARVPVGLLAALAGGIRTPLRERHGLGLGPRQVRAAESLIWRFLRFHTGLELRSEAFLGTALRDCVDATRARGDTAPARARLPGGATAQAGAPPPDPDAGRRPEPPSTRG